MLRIGFRKFSSLHVDEEHPAFIRVDKVVTALSLSASGTLVLSWLFGSSIRSLGVALALELSAALYYTIVVWNPSVRSFLSDGQPSQLFRVQCQNSDSSAPIEWSALFRNTGGRIDPAKYYKHWHGHDRADIANVHGTLKDNGCNSFIYLCGDSSLDNKAWFEEKAAAINGYENIFVRNGSMKKDVCYHLNKEACEKFGHGKTCTINTSVEATTLADREQYGLLVQDAFIRDHVSDKDYIIVSIGGNDIALNPTLRTIFNMLIFTRCPHLLIRLGLAPGLGYFVRFFRDRIQNMLSQVVAREKPRKILVCMIYYPLERPGGWADTSLRLLGYDSDPSKLQLIIRTVFSRIAKKGFDVPGTLVEPFALFDVLDATNPGDYENRVEPSAQGSEKMAKAFMKKLFAEKYAS